MEVLGHPGPPSTTTQMVQDRPVYLTYIYRYPILIVCYWVASAQRPLWATLHHPGQAKEAAHLLTIHFTPGTHTNMEDVLLTWWGRMHSTVTLTVTVGADDEAILSAEIQVPISHLVSTRCLVRSIKDCHASFVTTCSQPFSLDAHLFVRIYSQPFCLDVHLFVTDMQPAILSGCAPIC